MILNYLRDAFVFLKTSSFLNKSLVFTHVFDDQIWVKFIYVTDTENNFAIKMGCNMTHSYKFNDFHHSNKYKWIWYLMLEIILQYVLDFRFMIFIINFLMSIEYKISKLSSFFIIHLWTFLSKTKLFGTYVRRIVSWLWKLIAGIEETM